MLFQAKRFEEAESEMTKVLSVNPISVQNLIDRAAARCYLSKFEEAEMDAATWLLDWHHVGMPLTLIVHAPGWASRIMKDA